MSTYNKTEWKDHVTDSSGKVIQQGTNLSQDNFNNEENGIDDAHIALSTFFSEYIQRTRRYDTDLSGELASEEGTVVLSNTQKLPFNNSVKTISLSIVRSTTDYTVYYEVISVSGGCSGNVNIYDKMQNGFKIQFDGDATSVSVKYTVKGGGIKQ